LRCARLHYSRRHDHLWLAEDLPDLIDQAGVQYDWAVSTSR
jgi:hypothetical protein